MPRLIKAVPKYRKHKQSGQAIVTLNSRDYLLGPYDSKTSRKKYDQLIAEWLDRGRQPLALIESDLTVAELSNRYWSHAQTRYTRHGRPTAKQFKIKTALQHLLRIYEDHSAAEFGPKQLRVVRQSMINADWARSYVNEQVGVIVRLFKWAVTEGFIPPAVHATLDLVEGIRRGETAARETSKVQCIDDAIVDATLPYLSPTVRSMIELQRATGMRPGEVCILRPCDLDCDGDVWEYRPAEHKTAHHGHDRVICIGPRGQDALQPFLMRPADEFCFSPKESSEWHRSRRHESRKTPLSCGNVPGSNRARHPKRVPRDRYDVASYRRAIHRACDLAFPAPADAAAPQAHSEWQRKHRWSPHRWSPHRLRHTAATLIRKEFSLEAAKAVLGHSATNVTGVYAELDRQLAVEVAKRIG